MTITLRALASEIHMDKSHLRKLAIRLGVPMERARDPECRNQEVLTFDEDGATRIREYRRGFGKTPDAAPEGGRSMLYIVQLEPDRMPERIKLGIAVSVDSRLQDYRCANPHVHLLHSWPCERAWEAAAIAAITNDPTITRVAGEVYDVAYLRVVQDRGDTFFELMPDLR